VPEFVVSGTSAEKSSSAPGRLGQVVHAVTLLNTDSNLTNTDQRASQLPNKRPQRRAVGKKMEDWKRRVIVQARSDGEPVEERHALRRMGSDKGRHFPQASPNSRTAHLRVWFVWGVCQDTRGSDSGGIEGHRSECRFLHSISAPL